MKILRKAQYFVFFNIFNQHFPSEKRHKYGRGGMYALITMGVIKFDSFGLMYLLLTKSKDKITDINFEWAFQLIPAEDSRYDSSGAATSYLVLFLLCQEALSLKKENRIIHS